VSYFVVSLRRVQFANLQVEVSGSDDNHLAARELAASVLQAQPHRWKDPIVTCDDSYIFFPSTRAQADAAIRQVTATRWPSDGCSPCRCCGLLPDLVRDDASATNVDAYRVQCPCGACGPRAVGTTPSVAAGLAVEQWERLMAVRP